MRRFGSFLALVGGLSLAVAAVTPALAHEHPSGITDLVTPAVVRVEASRSRDHSARPRRRAAHVERSYDIPIGTGTGTVVNPEGAIVTLTRVVKTDHDVAVYAANKIFAAHHKVKIPLTTSGTSLKDHQLNHHLQECYPPKQPTATCIIDVTTDITIFPNVSPADTEGFKAEIVKAGSQPDSPAVLMPSGRAVGSVGMPTAPLADKVPDQDGSPTSVAGFTGRPGRERQGDRRDRPPAARAAAGDERPAVRRPGEQGRRAREARRPGRPRPARRAGHRRQGRPRHRHAHRRRQGRQDDRHQGDHRGAGRGRGRAAPRRRSTPPSRRR